MEKADISGFPDGRWIYQDAPRIPPVEKGEVSALNRFVLARIRSAAKSDRDFNAFRTFARLGSIFPAQALFISRILNHGRLPSEEKALVVMRVGWRLGCIYEYGHHFSSVRHKGASDVDIKSATSEESASADTRLGAFFNFSDQLVRDHFVTIEAWERARRFVSQDELLELCILIGHYVMIGMTLNTVGIQLEPEYGISADQKISQAHP